MRCLVGDVEVRDGQSAAIHQPVPGAGGSHPAMLVLPAFEEHAPIQDLYKDGPADAQGGLAQVGGRRHRLPRSALCSMSLAAARRRTSSLPWRNWRKARSVSGRPSMMVVGFAEKASANS